MRESRVDVSTLLTFRVKRARTVGGTNARRWRFYAQRPLVAARRVRHEFRARLRSWPSAPQLGGPRSPRNRLSTLHPGHSLPLLPHCAPSNRNGFNAVTSRARTRSVSQRTANVLTFPRLLMTDPTPDAMPRAPYRRFRDAGDGDWLVWRLSEDVVGEIREAPSLGRAWLIFLGPDGKTRRLAPVPPEWQRMSEEQLHELALRATHF